MKTITKRLVRAAALGIGMMTLAPLTASAGEWRLNPDRCPDIREDWRDMRHDRGWADRREDRRDSRVIECPARAWTYHRDRWERGRPGPYPRAVVLTRDGRVYERNRDGRLVSLGINLRLG